MVLFNLKHFLDTESFYERECLFYTGTGGTARTMPSNGNCNISVKNTRRFDYLFDFLHHGHCCSKCNAVARDHRHALHSTQSLGFCMTIRIKSLSGATMISCFLERTRKKVRSLPGSKSRTTLRALSDNWLIRPAYCTVVELSSVLFTGMPTTEQHSSHHIMRRTIRRVEQLAVRSI